MRSLLVMAILSTAATGGYEVQTDWSAGPGVQGPSPSWGAAFEQADSISWLASPGRLCLSSEPLASCPLSVVDGDIPLAGMASGDLDGDGMVDLAGASLVEGHVTWFRNLGGGSWEAVPMDGAFAGALGVAICDLDGDGDPDLLGAVHDPDRVVFWRNDGGAGPAGSPVVVDPLFPGVHSVTCALVNGDGIVDILGAASECDQIAVWFGQGGDAWVKYVIDPAFDGTQSVATGDFDGDGDVDAAGAAFELGEIAWWENPGTAGEAWAKHVVGSGFAGAHNVAVCDMNSDGRPDILGSAFTAGRSSWWENDGSAPPSWEQHVIAPSLTGALTSAAADFDGDGDLDAAACSWSLDRIRWFENVDGAGTVWTGRTVADGFNGAWPLVVIDSDGDGRIELAAGADVLTGPGPSHGPGIFELCSFRDSGSLTGSVLDTGENPCWAAFDWQAQTPSGTSVSAFWRSSDDPDELGAWSGPFGTPAELSGTVHRYVQYRIEMTSTDSLSSPLIEELSLSWDPEGIDPDAEEGGLISLMVPNPCPAGFADLEVRSGTGSGGARISVYDVAGRIAWSGVAPEGGARVRTGRLHPGLYIVRAVSGIDSDVVRLMVL